MILLSISMNQEALMDRIRALRISKGISQEEMAFALDISQGNYAKIENNKVAIGLSKLNRIAQFLDVELSTLMHLHKKDD